MKDLIRRHPIAAYFVAAFSFSWIAWAGLVIGTPPGGMQAGISLTFFLMAILGGLGPSLAGLAITGVIGGRQGVRALLARLRPDCVRWGWYLVILIPFGVALMALAVQRMLGWKTDLGDIASRIPLALAWPLFSSLGEELGWRGFALPRLQARRSALVSTLLLGLIWGLWHLPPDWIAMRHYGPLFLLYFVLAGPALLTGEALLMTWVFNNTRGNVLLGVLFHYGITSSAILLGPLDLSPVENVNSTLVNVFVYWVIAGVLLIIYGGSHLARSAHYMEKA